MIELKNFTGQAVFGLYESERLKPQAYECEVSGKYRSFNMESFADYALLEGVIRFIIENGKFFTIEEALETLTWFFSLSLLPAVRLMQELSVKISKPEILASGTVPSVSGSMQCAHLPCVEDELTQQSASTGVKFTVIQLNSTDPISFQHFSKEIALVLNGELAWGDQLFTPGDCVFTREKDAQAMQVPGDKGCILLKILFQGEQAGSQVHPKEKYF